MSIEALMIGVSGMRGVVGRTLTPPIVLQMTSAFSAWLIEHRGKTGNAFTSARPLKVVFGRDSRQSGQWVRDCVVAALAASGIEVIDLDIVTSPGVAMMVQHLQADAGMIATASHNPIEWNGLKFLNHQGIAPPREAITEIHTLFDSHATKL